MLSESSPSEKTAGKAKTMETVKKIKFPEMEGRGKEKQAEHRGFGGR